MKKTFKRVITTTEYEAVIMNEDGQINTETFNFSTKFRGEKAAKEAITKLIPESAHCLAAVLRGTGKSTYEMDINTFIKYGTYISTEVIDETNPVNEDKEG